MHRALRSSGNIKLGLFILAILIIAGSLLYTNWLVLELRHDNQRYLQYNAKLLANALATDAQAKKYREERRQFLVFNANLYASALSTEAAGLDFAFNEIIRNIAFPVIITVREGGRSEIYAHKNIEFPDPGMDAESVTEFLRKEIERMDSENEPIPVEYLEREVMLIHFGNPAEGQFENLLHKILESITFPIIITRGSGEDLQITNHSVRGLEELDPSTKEASLRQMIGRMDAQNEPIGVFFQGQRILDIHYLDSGIILALRWFPLIELIIFTTFILLGFAGIQFLRNAERRGIWVGMSKETAHQLGTPLSSLMGWIELLKDQDLPTSALEVVQDMEKDVQRLQQVAERFSKIGTGVALKAIPVTEVVEPVVDYVRRRIPQWGKTIEIGMTGPRDLQVMANPELLGWALENLLKNAVDAIDQEQGRIDIRIQGGLGQVVVEIEDNGRGIHARDHKNVFRPGWSSKKRGWGLGLSLVDRIIREYHQGHITLSSAPGLGTIFRVQLKPVSNP